jgi:hypothetical protein
MPNFENLQASAQAGVSQVRINTPPVRRNENFKLTANSWPFSGTPVCLVVFLPRREELAGLQQSPILSMGPELETTRVELHFTAHTSLMIQGGGPGYSTQGLSKSLIYNISLMAGQTRSYVLWTSKLQADTAPFAR